MGMKITKGKTLPIGVDPGSHVTKLAQLRLAGDALELIAAGSVEAPAADEKDRHGRLRELSGRLRGLVRASGCKGNQCMLSLPAQETFVHHVKIAKVAPPQTAAAVRAELEGKLPYPVRDAVVRHVVAGEVYGDGEKKQEVLTVSAPRATVEAYVGMARQARLDVVGVNVEPCAIVDCFSRLFRRQEDVARAILFVDIGLASTQVAMAHGPRIVFARNLAIGGRRFDEAVAEGLNVSLAEANARRRQVQETPPDEADREAFYRMLDAAVRELTEGLTQCLRYYEAAFRNQGIERAIFLGGQARDAKLCEAIARRLNLPAQIGDPMTRVQRTGPQCPGSPDLRQPEPAWAVAVGLSLGGARAA
jgi:type IV pilus assembly protein PilM